MQKNVRPARLAAAPALQACVPSVASQQSWSGAHIQLSASGVFFRCKKVSAPTPNRRLLHEDAIALEGRGKPRHALQGRRKMLEHYPHTILQNLLKDYYQNLTVIGADPSLTTSLYSL